MPRPKFQTLTEQMFYILLCLKDECYGIDIFDKISALTGDQVTVGSGGQGRGPTPQLHPDR